METYTSKPGLDQDFDGLTADTGLFLPEATGGNNIRVLVNSIKFTADSLTSWQFYSVDPSDGNRRYLMFSGTEASINSGGPGGFEFLNRNEDGKSWGYALVTLGLAGDGVLKIGHTQDPSN